MPQRRHTLWTGGPLWEGKSSEKNMYCKQCNEIPLLTTISYLPEYEIIMHSARSSSTCYSCLCNVAA